MIYTGFGTAHNPFQAAMTSGLHGFSDVLPAQLFRAIVIAPTTTPYPAAPPGGRLSYAVVINGQPAAGVSTESSKEVGEEGPASGARGRDVDDRIPEAHEGKDDACSVGVGDGDFLGVDEGVDAVDGRRHPGDEQGDEKQGSYLCVTESRPVGFHSCPVFLLLLVFDARVVRH